MDRTVYEALEAALQALATLTGLTVSDNGAAWQLDESAAIATLRAVLDGVTAVTDPVGQTVCAWCGAPTPLAAYVCGDHAPPVRELAPA